MKKLLIAICILFIGCKSEDDEQNFLTTAKYIVLDKTQTDTRLGSSYSFYLYDGSISTWYSTTKELFAVYKKLDTINSVVLIKTIKKKRKIMFPRKLHIEQVDRFHDGIKKLGERIEAAPTKDEKATLSIQYFELCELWAEIDNFIEYKIKMHLDKIDL